MTDFRNRIIGYGEEDPNVLQANKLNWRTHSKAQQKALEGVLSDVGVVQNIIVNKRTGNLVDGHLRVSVAIKNKQAKVPITYVDLSPEEEALILTTLDPIGAMAGTDRANLEELMHQFNSTNNLVQELVSEIAEDAHLYHEAVRIQEGEQPKEEEEEDVPDGYVDNDEKSIIELNGDTRLKRFSASNTWGIPDYLIGMCADVDIEDTWAGQPIKDASKTLFLYGTNAFPPEAAGGTLAFYTHDQRFEVLWNDPSKVTAKFLEQGWGAVVAPDFSVLVDDPLAQQLWNVYRSRWVARYWQEAGLKVIPTFFWPIDDRMSEFSLNTIPKKVPVVALQIRAMKKDSASSRANYINEMNHLISTVKPGKLLVYGGTEHREWIEPNLPKEQPVIWAKSWTKARDEWRFPERGKKPKPSKSKE